MKGFRLYINDECISGAIESGITSILITNKVGSSDVHFCSLDNTGMHAYTWYASDLKIGDAMTICFEDLVQVSNPKETRDYYYRSQEEIQADEIKEYERLKAELIAEGLISEHRS